MSHKLQLHLLLDHISAKITANAAIGLRSLANHVCAQFIPLCLKTRGTHVKKFPTQGVINRINKTYISNVLLFCDAMLVVEFKNLKMFSCSVIKLPSF